MHPARPEYPQLLSPRDVPKRKPGSVEGRIALLHAVAHIELNAVDLHWDIIARFSDIPMPLGFFDDWVKAASEESNHFKLISSCLEQMDSYYGALPAHAVMWRAAEDTKSDLLGRLYQRIKYLTYFFGIPRLPVVGFNVLLQMGGDHGSSDQGNT